MQRAQIWIVIHAIREVSENQQIFRKDHDPLSNLGYDEVWETTSLNIDCKALGSAWRARRTAQALRLSWLESVGSK